MTTSDITELRDGLKESVKKWAGEKIDALFPNKPQTRVILKRGLRNYLAKEDEKIDGMISGAMVFIGDENGEVNTDSAIDLLVSLFKEMDVSEYKLGFVSATVGKGEIALNLPHHPVLDMIVGDLGKVTIKADDILEIKSLFDEPPA